MLGFSPRFLAFAALGLLVLPACGSQAGTSYRGEPLATFEGTVQNSASDPIPPPVPALVVALSWTGTPIGSDAKVALYTPEVSSAVPVSGQFPTSFSMQLFVPPPDSALFSCFPDDPSHAGKLASAEIEAVLQATIGKVSTDIRDVYGTVPDATVVYADVDIEPGNACIPAGISKGYHLGSFSRGPDVAGCVRGAPDDPKCNGPLQFDELPVGTALTLTLHHEDGMALPPSPSPNP